MSANTVVQGEALIGFRPVARAELVIHVGNGRFDLLTLIPIFGQLLRAERNKYAENNDPDLAEEDAPAVQRFWQLNVHAVGPRSYGSVTDGYMPAMGRKLPLRSIYRGVYGCASRPANSLRDRNAPLAHQRHTDRLQRG